VVDRIVGRYVGESGKTHKCGTYSCAKPLKYTAGPMVRLVPKNEVSIRAELLHGPIYAGVTCWSDLFHYKSGIYVTSEDAKDEGGHAMAVIGWGAEGQTKYWIMTNSWGEDWGENGYMRVTDEFIMGDLDDLITINSPAAVPCASTPSCNHGDLDADCKCVCDENWSAAKAGAACDVCENHCLNNGVLSANDCSCLCPQGYFGNSCANYIIGYWESADLQRDTARIIVAWNIEESRWLGHGRVSRYTGLPAEDAELYAHTSVPMAVRQGSLSMNVETISKGCGIQRANIPHCTVLLVLLVCALRRSPECLCVRHRTGIRRRNTFMLCVERRLLYVVAYRYAPPSSSKLRRRPLRRILQYNHRNRVGVVGVAARSRNMSFCAAWR
jgi:hypothetical protein